MSTSKTVKRTPAKTAVKTPARRAAPAKPAAGKAKPAATAKAPARKAVMAKSIKPGKPSPAKPAKPAKTPDASPAKPPKNKLVRDSFTMPKLEYLVIESLKQRGAALAKPLKKSEVLRAGVKALAAMSDEQFLAAVAAVPAIKTGRPKTKKPGAPLGEKPADARSLD